MIAALFVDPKGCYAGIEGVELWDEARDARTYEGPHPVVAHPPCSHWCQLAGLVEARWGHRKGDDGGCFESALAAVRKWSGVLEHPAFSKAWDRYGLPKPITGAGWQRGICGGWVCYVVQARYGHPARKATWLYAYGVDPAPMRWGYTNESGATWSYSKKNPKLVSWCSNRGQDDRPRVTHKEASATPPQFRDALIRMAQSARPSPGQKLRVV